VVTCHAVFAVGDGDKQMLLRYTPIYQLSAVQPSSHTRHTNRTARAAFAHRVAKLTAAFWFAG